MSRRERIWFFNRAHEDYMDEEQVVARDTLRREQVVKSDPRYRKPSEVLPALVFPFDSEETPENDAS